jgi:stage V sporulation protein S
MDPKYSNYPFGQPAVEVAQPLEEPVQPRLSGSDLTSPLSLTPPGSTSTEVEMLKVSGHSKPGLVAGAIAGVVRQKGRVEVQAIGAGAINQAIKAVAIARGYLISGGIDICFIPAFIDIIINQEERTGIKLLIEHRHHSRFV